MDISKVNNYDDLFNVFGKSYFKGEIVKNVNDILIK